METIGRVKGLEGFRAPLEDPVQGHEYYGNGIYPNSIYDGHKVPR